MAQVLVSPKKCIKNVNVTHNSSGVIVSADVLSRSRAGLLHYTRIVIIPKTNEIVKASCDCEGFTFRKKCWHLYLLKALINSELKEKVLEEQVLWFKEKMSKYEVKLSQIWRIINDDSEED